MEGAFGVGHREARALRDALAGIADVVEQGADPILPGRDAEQLTDHPIDQGGFIGGVPVQRHAVNDGEAASRFERREDGAQALAAVCQLRIAHSNVGGRLEMTPLALDKGIERGEAVGGKGVVPGSGVVNGLTGPGPAAALDGG